MEYIIGIEIGGSKLQVFLSESKLKIIKKFFKDVGDTKEASHILDMITSIVDELVLKYKIKAISVGFGGPIDYKTGQIFTSYQVGSWQNFQLVQWLENKYQTKVIVENDANTAAFAEAHLGRGKGYSRVFYITLGSGVGGGFIIDGKLYHGKAPCESEIGHIRLDKSGKTLESSCSGWAIDDKLRKYMTENCECIIGRLAKDSNKSEASFLNQAIDSGDSEAKEILDTAIDDLVFGISHVVHLLHPEIIIIGGGISLIGKYLEDKVNQCLPKYLMSSIRDNPPVVRLAKLKKDVVPIGAILLAGIDDQ
jgi:glucokinase